MGQVQSTSSGPTTSWSEVGTVRYCSKTRQLSLWHGTPGGQLQSEPSWVMVGRISPAATNSQHCVVGNHRVTSKTTIRERAWRMRISLTSDRGLSISMPSGVEIVTCSPMEFRAPPRCVRSRLASALSATDGQIHRDRPSQPANRYGSGWMIARIGTTRPPWRMLPGWRCTFSCSCTCGSGPCNRFFPQLFNTAPDST
jgi:hypothetical protein